MSKYDCDIIFDLLPVSKGVISASEKQVKKFAISVSSDIINPENQGMTIKQYKEVCFQEQLSILYEQNEKENISKKMYPYIESLICDFPTFNFTDVFIRNDEKELWIIADYVNSEISDEFFEIACRVWKDIFVDFDIVFVGENELNRELMPDNMRQIPIFAGA